LNPHLTAAPSAGFISERFYYPLTVGMGETNLAGDVRYGLTHNFRKFLFILTKKNSYDIPKPENSFFPVTILKPYFYKEEQVFETARAF